MKRALAYGLFGLLAYAFFLLAQAPAALVWKQIRIQAPALDAERVHGTLANGQALAVRSSGLDLADMLEWNLLPLNLLLGRLSYTLHLDGPELNLTAQVSMDWNRQLRLESVTGNIALGAIVALADIPTVAPLTGDLRLALDDVRLDKQGRLHQLHGQLHILDASLKLSRSVRLGDFNIALTSAEQAIRGEINDTGGELKLSGRLSLSADGRYRVSGLLDLADHGDPELRQLISLLGNPAAAGGWRFNVSGVLAD